jgi:hypothetical protein
MFKASLGFCFSFDLVSFCVFFAVTLGGLRHKYHG